MAYNIFIKPQIWKQTIQSHDNCNDIQRLDRQSDLNIWVGGLKKSAFMLIFFILICCISDVSDDIWGRRPSMIMLPYYIFSLHN